ncbi:plasmid pRiA4b ORF-3 family protein [Corynebacterium sp. A21]|uniref:plasmid pRiA4b ORF-3 family protein n=1 Tax=Corynebacterium sp. A21 TaxID=3457318 RepID=UPI003FD3ECDA
MAASVIDLNSRRNLKGWSTLRLELHGLPEPVSREYLVDTSLPAVQVIDLLAVGLGLVPSPTTVLELHRRNASPRYAGRAEYHVNNEALWDVTGKDFAEVLDTAAKLEAQVWVDLAPAKGWRFLIQVATPEASVVELSEAPFSVLEEVPGLMDPDIAVTVATAIEQVKAGREVAPQLQMAMLQDNAGARAHIDSRAPVAILISSYVRLLREDLVFPWFGLFETYLYHSRLHQGTFELYQFVAEKGTVKLLKNGILSVADARKLIGVSEFFATEWELKDDVGTSATELRSSGDLPHLRSCLEALLETPLVRLAGQELSVNLDPSARSEADNMTSYSLAVVEIFIADIRSGRLAEDTGDLCYPLPEQILKLAPGVSFTAMPEAGDISYDNYVDDPLVKSFLAAAAQQLRPIPSSPRGKQVLLADFFAEIDSAEVFPPEEEDMADDFSDFWFQELPKQVDPTLLPGQPTGPENKNFKGTVDHIEFEMTLDYVEPAVTRVLQLPVALTADKAMQLMLVLFGWELSHLYDLSIQKPDTRKRGDRIYVYPPVPGLEPMQDYVWADQVEIGQVLVPHRTAATINYDYGDGWSMTLKARKLVRQPAGAYVVSAANGCPPEDCGGPPGFADIRQVLKLGPTAAVRSNKYLDAEWAAELHEVFAGLDLDNPQFGPGTYSLDIGPSY